MSGDVEMGLTRGQTFRVWMPVGAALALIMAAVAVIAWINGQVIRVQIAADNAQSVVAINESITALDRKIDEKSTTLEYAIKDIRDDGALKTWIKLFRAANESKNPELVVPDIP